MTFRSNGQTWQVIENCKNGVIAVLVVDGRKTKRRGYFPVPYQLRAIEMMSSYPLSFDNAQSEIPIALGGTPANAFDHYPYGAAGQILKKSTLAEIEAEGWDISEVVEHGRLTDCLYLFEFKDGRPNEYVWRENLYPVPLGGAMRFIGEPAFCLYQLVIVHLDKDGVHQQHVTEILRRYYDIDQAQWFYALRGLDGLHSEEVIDFKKKRNDRAELESPLLTGQRIRVHTLTADGAIYDQDGTVKGYTEEGELLVRLDTQGYPTRLSPEWDFEVLPGEPIHHWQVWQVSESGERLLRDDFETPLAAEYFAKQQDKEYHQVASRHDDWVPPPRFEVRTVPMEGDRL